jgi:hypothetical protein
LDHHFNVDAFSQPPEDLYGSAPRTLPNYRTFGIRNADVSLRKNFTISEQKSIQFPLDEMSNEFLERRDLWLTHPIL